MVEAPNGVKASLSTVHTALHHKTRHGQAGVSRPRSEFGIGILIIGANLYRGVYKLRILIRKILEDFSRIFIGFSVFFIVFRWVFFVENFNKEKTKGFFIRF